MDERVLVYGAGVIGSVYAVRLAKAGLDVTVVARGDRLRAIRDGGLRIRHVLLDEEERAEVRVTGTLDGSQEHGLILVTVRAGQIENALRDVYRYGENGTVLVVGNNIQGHAAQAALIGQERFVLGFGAFGGYRDEGAIVYVDGRSPGKPEPTNRRVTTLGVLDAEAEPALSQAEDAFGRAGLPTKRSPDVVAWLVCHAALVFPLAGAMYAAGGDQARTCRTRDALVVGFHACRELFRALRKLGVATEPRSLRGLLRMPEPLIVGFLERSLAGESARVAMFGHANAPGGRDEVAGRARDLDAIVRRAGLPLQSWERLLPYFAPGNGAPLIADGSRTLRLRLW